MTRLDTTEAVERAGTEELSAMEPLLPTEAPPVPESALRPEKDSDLALALLQGESWAERTADEWATPETMPLTCAVRRLLAAAQIGRQAVQASQQRQGRENRTGVHLAFRATLLMEAALTVLEEGRRPPSA